MRPTLPGIALLLAAACCSCSPAPDEYSVILVTLDTTRADRIGAYGGEAVPTANLDRIASEGVLFESAFSQVPLTLPAHSSILSGLYPAAHGVRHNGIYRLPEEVETLTERLRREGFDTAAFIGAYVLNRGFGTEQGFDTYDDVPVNRFQGGADRLFEAERTAGEVNESVFRWLEEPRGERIFLWVHYYDPHDPYAPPEEGRQLEGEGYDREISYLDACIGDLLDRLERDGRLDRSILVVVGDHGEALGEHRERTHGLFLYEEAMHVPLIFRAPGLLPAGERVDGPAGLVDLAPTILELLEMAPIGGVQGRSLLPNIRGAEDGTLELAFGETWMPRLEFGWSELYMVRSDRYKYIRAPRPELYDLQEDPEEELNLADSDPERAGEMALWLEEWLGAGADMLPEATRQLTPEEEERLRSLGYMGGDAFRGGLETDGPLPDPKDKIDEMLRLDDARALLTAGEFTGALEASEALLRDNPLNQWARTTRISALIRLNRIADAEEEARAGVALLAADPGRSDSQEARILGMLAAALRLQGENREAEELFRKIIELDPVNDHAAVDLSRLLSETGRHEEALAVAGEVLSSNPSNGMAMAARMWAEVGLGRTGDARASAAALADAGAGDPHSMVRAGDILTEAGDPGRAAACYRAALEQAGETPALLGKLGASLLSAGEHDQAERIFTAAAALSPGDPRPPFYLGEIALLRGDAGLARERFDRASSINPRFTAPRRSLARWLAGRGEVEQAKAELRRALRSNPGDSQARQMLEQLSGGG